MLSRLFFPFAVNRIPPLPQTPPDSSQAQPSSPGLSALASVPPPNRPDRRLAEVRLGVAQEGFVVVRIPDSDYRLDLKTVSSLGGHRQGERVHGIIRAEALRIDVIEAGGRFIEPVYGRPRRLQGRIVGGDPDRQEIWVNVAVPIVCKLDPSQKITEFKTGMMVSFDIRAGATFEVVE